MEPVRANEPVQKRRRIHGKQSIGQLAVMAATVCMAARLGVEEALWKEAFLQDEELCAETQGARKAVYLVTLPHPRQIEGGHDNLRSPGTMTRQDVVSMFLEVFRRPEYVDAAAASRNGPSIQVDKMVVFQELHKADENGLRHAHYHIALQLSGTARFAPYKRALRMRFGVASHWSCTHDGYWSTVRYGFVWTPKKPKEDLDKQPFCWSRQGQHPPLSEASQPNNMAAALKKRREHKVELAIGAGKPEPRATELDLYSIIVEKGFRNTADEPWAHKRLIEHLRNSASPSVFNLAWKLRSKLGALIDDVWAWETISDHLALLG